YTCATCKSTSAREIDVAQNWDVLKFATAPELKCDDCGNPVTCAASETLLAHLPTLPRPDVPPELKKQLKHFQDEALKKALQAKSPGAGPGFVLPQAGGSAPLRGGLSWPTVLAAVGIVIGLAAAAIIAKSVANRGGSDSGEKLEASQ